MAFPEPRLDPLDIDLQDTARASAALAIRNARKAALAADVRRGLAWVGHEAWVFGKPLGEAALAAALAGAGIPPVVVPIISALVGKAEAGIESAVEAHLAGASVT